MPLLFYRSYVSFICLFLMALLAKPAPLAAQELNCNVVIRPGNQITGVDPRLFAQMKQAIQEFMNLRRWTTDAYQNEERILCNIIITLNQMPSLGRFKATAQIQSARPVFGASYESVLLNYLDNEWEIEYTEGQPLDFVENTYTTELTSVLAFYAYMIIGYDADSFSKFGGKPHYLKAQTIELNAQQGSRKGWKAFDGTNSRYWLLENMLNQQVNPFREGVYNYHRLCLDKFLENPETCRVHVLDMLTKCKTILQLKPQTLVINNFFDAKSNEIVNIFTEATPQEKQAAYNILAQIDPSKQEIYQKLIK